MHAGTIAPHGFANSKTSWDTWELSSTNVISYHFGNRTSAAAGGTAPSTELVMFWNLRS